MLLMPFKTICLNYLQRVQEASGVLSALSMTASFLMLAVQDQDPLFQSKFIFSFFRPVLLLRHLWFVLFQHYISSRKQLIRCLILYIHITQRLNKIKIIFSLSVHRCSYIIPTSLFYQVNGHCFKFATSHKNMLPSMPTWLVNAFFIRINP